MSVPEQGPLPLRSSPRKRRPRRFFPLLLALLAVVCLGGPTRGRAEPASVPSAGWESARPETQGYSGARLEALRGWLRTQPTSAMLVVAHGKVIFEYGDVAKPSKIASVRKSILAMLYGSYVVAGKIDLARTVVDVGLQERAPFLPRETHATLEQLLTARAGIYLDPRQDELTEHQPVRGTDFPGTAFFYNNWQFDAAGTAFEKLTGKNIYDAFENDLARPLGMQDFRRDQQRKIPSPGSVHPEYAMWLSARDMARLGLLMLRRGDWNGREILPHDWVRYTTSVVTPWDEMNPPLLRLRGMPDRWGFGAGWWVWDAPPFPSGVTESPFQGAFEARGVGGQYITVLPARDLVLIHTVDLAVHPDASSGLTELAWETILGMVIDSACGPRC